MGLRARPPLTSQTRGRGRKARPRPGLAPAGITVSEGPQWLPRRHRLVAPVPTLSETTRTPAPLPRPPPPQGSAFLGAPGGNWWKEKGLLEFAKPRWRGALRRDGLAALG